MLPSLRPRPSRPGVFWFIATAFLSLQSPAGTTDSSRDLAIVDYQKVAERRVARDACEFDIKAVLGNKGRAIAGAKATITRWSTRTNIVDGDLTFGAVSAQGRTVSLDTFTIRQTRGARCHLEDLLEDLRWKIVPVEASVADLTPGQLTIANGGSGTLTVRILNPEPAPMTVTIEVGDSTLVAAPPSVVIPADETTVAFLVTGIAPAASVPVRVTLNGTSAKALVTVQGRPRAPTLTEPLVEGSSIVGGSGIASALVSVQVDGLASGSQVVLADGRFAVVVPTLRAGQKVTATQAVSGLTSDPSAPVVVRARPPAPTVGVPLVAGSTIVRGNGAADAYISVFTNGQPSGSGSAAADGTFAITVLALVAGQQITATQTIAGIESIPSAPVTTVAVPPPPTIAVPVIEGSNVVSGTGLPGARVEVLMDASSVGSANVGDAGAWTITTPALVAGQALTAQQTLNLVASALTAPVLVVARPPAPSLHQPIIEGATTIAGTGLAGAVVEAFVNGAAAGTVTAAGDGSWSVTVAPLLAGQLLTARQTVNGVPSLLATPVAVLAVPPAPVVSAPLIAGDTTVGGTSSPAAGIEVFIEGSATGLATAGTAGTWSVTLDRSLVIGEQVTARQTVAGIPSAVSAPVVVRGRPAAPTVAAPIAAGATTVRGTGVAGASLEVFVDDVSVGTTAVGADGTWALPVSSLIAGQRITARQVVAGIASIRSEPVIVQAALVGIAITPAPAVTIAPGETVQFTAQGTFSDGSIQTSLDGVLWVSGNGTVASISSSGVLLGVGAGSTHVQASREGVTSPSTSVTVSMPAGNQPPVVDAGEDIDTSVFARTTLPGAATDDGLPVGTLTVTWQKVSGPGVVTFFDNRLPATEAIFGSVGEYVLRLTASDSLLTVHDEVIVRVGCPAGAYPQGDLVICDDFNRPDGSVGNGWRTWSTQYDPPSSTIGVSGGELLTHGYPNYGGGVFRPLPVTLPVAFSFDFRSGQTAQVCSPGDEASWAIGFNNAPQAISKLINDDTTPAQLRLIQFSGQANVVRSHWNGSRWELTYSPNLPEPILTQRSFRPGIAAHIEGAFADDLSGSVTVWYNDGLTPESTTFSFPPVAGARLAPGGTLVFGNATCNTGEFRFDNLVVREGLAPTLLALSLTPRPDASLYRAAPLQITARGVFSDGSVQEPLLGADWTSTNPSVASVTSTGLVIGESTGVAGITARRDGLTSPSTRVTVAPFTGNLPPIVSAGGDVTGDYLSSIPLSGTVRDDGLPAGVLTIGWHVVSGPGTVTFANALAARTSATFDRMGTYLLRLTASDSLVSVSDDVVVSVGCPSGPYPNEDLAFCDDFNRRNGLVQNGWRTWSTTGYDPEAPRIAISDGELVTRGPGAGGGVFRTLPVALPLFFSFDFRPMCPPPGCGGFGDDTAWAIAFNASPQADSALVNGVTPAQLKLVQFSGQQNLQRAHWTGTTWLYTEAPNLPEPIPTQRAYRSGTAVHIEGSFAADLSGSVTVWYNDGLSPESTTFTYPPVAVVSPAPGASLVLGHTSGDPAEFRFDNLIVRSAATPRVVSVDPRIGTRGQALDVRVVGANTHFAQGSTRVSLGPGLASSGVTVLGPTELVARVVVDASAALGGRTLAVTTGTESLILSDAFTVVAALALTRIDITPGGSVALNKGESIPFVARGTRSDGSVEEPLAGVTWTSSTPSVVHISATGAAIGLSAGNAGITAARDGLQSASTALLVKPLPIAINGPINGGATIVGGAAAEPGASVQVSVNGLPRGPTVVATASGVWGVSGISPALAVGDSVTARQTVNGVESDTSLPVVVMAGTPGLVSVTPASGTAGQQNLRVVLVAQFTHFQQGTTQVAFAGTAVRVTSVTVLSPTLLAANLSIDSNALAAPRTVTVTTGAEVVTLANAFTVQPGTNQSPVIAIAPTWAVTLPNRLGVTYTVTDDGLPLGGALTVEWSTVSGPGAVGYQNQTPTSISVGFDQPGLYTLRMTATDTQFTLSHDVTVTVSAATGGGSLIAAITSPADGGEIMAPVAVIGTASGPGFASWTLEVRSLGETTFRAIASGTSPVTNGPLGTLDPTLLLNGLTALRLRATDSGGQTATYGPINVVVSQNQKVGNFTVSFNDLTVPVAGLPIQIVRTYDSRDKRSGDFGVGWRLDLKSVTLSTNGRLGDDWSGTSSGGLFRTYCITAVRSKVVTVTFADGTVFQFRPTLSPQCQQLVPPTQTTVSFAPISTTPPNVSLAVVGNATAFVPGPFPGFFSLLDLDETSTFDPTLYRLTLPDGRAFLIGAQSGLQSMTDLNDNTLTVSPTGVTHSSGKSVGFLRDAAGRITRVTDPLGNAITYTYDAAGDLRSVMDTTNNTTTYTYNASHGLLTILDPRGVQPIRNVYDDTGRLIQHVDAFGNVINYTHDLNTRQEIVTDRLNHVTVNEYDERGNVVRVTDAAGGVTTRTYDARNNLLTETTPLGHTRTFTYDGNNNRETERDALGNTTTYTHNARNQVLTIRNPRGSLTTNLYDGNGNLQRTTDALGQVTTYTYNTRGQQTSVTDPLNHVTGSQYDGAGNLTQQTDALGRTTTYTYDANGNRRTESRTRTTSTGPETLLTQYEYDAQNRLTRTIFPDGSTTRVVYNAIGKQASTFDKLNRETRFEYDLMGRLTRTTFPDDTSESSIYDAEGHRRSSTDRAGRVTQYEVDALGRLTRTLFADNTATRTEYDAAGQVSRTIDARGNATVFGYNEAGRRTSVTDALGRVTRFEYDEAGNQIRMRDANTHVTQFEYDALNRRTRTIHPDTTGDTIVFDAPGRTIRKIDQAGVLTQYEYDALGRLTAVIDALNQRTSYTYDEVGNRITQTDARGRTTRFAYDAMGRRTGRTLPLGQTERSTYHATGTQATKTDFNGRMTTYEYDQMNRPTAKMPDPVLAEPTVRFTYGPTGQRTQMVDASGTTTYTYDERDRLRTKATPQGTLTYTYNAAGSLASIRSSNAGGTSVDYTYDALNRPSTVTDNRLTPGVTTYAYDNVGNLESYVYPNGVRHAYRYDALNRLENLTVTAGASALASYAYTLGPTGNRTRVVELGGRQVDYGYDELYRLRQETITGATPSGTSSYAYDEVGNRLSRSSPTTGLTNYTYDDNDRLSTDTYDNNGNTTASGGAVYGYDFENHLTSQNGGTVRIVYDGDGNRVAKTVGGTTTRYLVDDRNPTGYAQVLEELGNGSVQRHYAYGLDLISLNQSSGVSFYVYDGLASVRLLTDASAVVSDRYDYDGFGNLLTGTGGTPNSYRYRGEQFDSELGSYYLRARYMNPSLGRFATQDPFEGSLGRPYSLHRYLYANADPVNKSDPSGLFTLVELTTTTTILNLQTVYAGKLLVPAFLKTNVVAECVLQPAFALRSVAIAAISNGAGPWAHELEARARGQIAYGYQQVKSVIANQYMTFFSFLQNDAVRIRTELSSPALNELASNFLISGFIQKAEEVAKYGRKLHAILDTMADAYGYWSANPSRCGAARLFAAAGCLLADSTIDFGSTSVRDVEQFGPDFSEEQIVSISEQIKQALRNQLQ